MNVDLQQRGIEFSQLFRNHNNLRPALLEKMPPMQITRNMSQENGDSTQDDSNSDLIENGSEESETLGGGGNANTLMGTDSNALLDLLGSADIISVPTNKSIQSNTTKTNTSNNQDLLDLLGGLDLSAPTLTTSTTTAIPPISNSILSLGFDNNNGNSIMPMGKTSFDNNELNTIEDAGIFDNFNIISDLNQVGS